MSKTTKDRPYWVKSNDPALRGPAHHRCSEYWFVKKFGENCCDIDVPIGATDTRRICWYYLSNTALSRYRYTRGPSKAERKLDYWAPNRRRVRDSINDVKGQHRAGHIIDDSNVEVDNHRHAPDHGGYWD